MAPKGPTEARNLRILEPCTDLTSLVGAFSTRDPRASAASSPDMALDFGEKGLRKVSDRRRGGTLGEHFGQVMGR